MPEWVLVVLTVMQLTPHIEGAADAPVIKTVMLEVRYESQEECMAALSETEIGLGARAQDPDRDPPLVGYTLMCEER